MKKKLLLVIMAITLVTSLGIASVANAAGTDDTASVTERPHGTLDAQGDGIGILGGKGFVDATGNGILWVRDITGDATINVDGYGNKKEFTDGWIQYSGFNGTAHVEGSLIIVMISGVDVNLHAEGRGRVRLWGHGSYNINGQTGDWGTRSAIGMSFTNPYLPEGE